MRSVHEIRQNLWLCEASRSGIAVRGAVVMGERYAAVWDSLAHPEDVAALAEILGEKPYYLIYSHADWDHCWGSSGLARPPINIIGHAQCRRRFDDDAPATLRRMQLEQAEHWDAVELRAPNLSFSKSLTLDLGGVNLELRHLPGHTSDCIVGWLPQWSTLLGGDAIETPLPVVNSADELGAWLARLESWAALPGLSLTIPAHGSCLGRDALETTIAYLRALTGGRDFDLPPKLSPFYAETHRKNLRIAAGAPVNDD